MFFFFLFDEEGWFFFFFAEWEEGWLSELKICNEILKRFIILLELERPPKFTQNERNF